MLFNEPKLLKLSAPPYHLTSPSRFSALQRAEIAETRVGARVREHQRHVSVLFNEPKLLKPLLIDKITVFVERVSVLFNEPKLLKPSRRSISTSTTRRVSVLFNEPKLLKLLRTISPTQARTLVSVLFNEPKLLKPGERRGLHVEGDGFSALQRAEIAETCHSLNAAPSPSAFQCSSTSRNC